MARINYRINILINLLLRTLGITRGTTSGVERKAPATDPRGRSGYPGPASLISAIIYFN